MLVSIQYKIVALSKCRELLIYNKLTYISDFNILLII